MMKFLSKLALSLVSLGIIFGAGYLFSEYRNEKEYEIVDTDDKNDWKLPGEIEIKIVTHEHVESKLLEIKEFASYTGHYQVSKGEKDLRAILDDIGIFFTSNEINLSCSGIVKVYYDINQMHAKVDNESQKIYINLPDQQVENYLIAETLECNEKNNFLNPIEFEQYKELFIDLEEMGLEDVENQGIYNLAEENIKNFIKNYLQSSFDYEVIFM